jgi:hypothetical protein
VRIQIGYTLFTFETSMYPPPVKKIATPMTNPAVDPSKIAGHLDGSADRRIRAFLSGASDGEDVLNALYGDALAEPIPQRLRDILKR